MNGRYNTIKTRYIAVGIFWISSIFLLVVNNDKCQWISTNDTNLIIGGIAVLVSIISLSIADGRTPSFKGNINLWVVSSNAKFSEVEENTHAEFSEISIKIVNKSKDAVNELLVSIRLPSVLYLKSDNEKNGYDYFWFKESLIITSDKIRFLGNQTGDNTITFEHYLRINKMHDNRKIYITIAGQNISPTTYSLSKQDLVGLSKCSSKNPFIVSKT